jgi:hypothetical protein
MRNTWLTQASPTVSTSIIAGSSSFDLLNTTATTLNAFGAAATGNIGYSGTDNSTTNISTGAAASGKTKTLNLATGAASGSTSNVNVGSANGGTTTINSPTTTLKALTTTNTLTVNGGNFLQVLNPDSTTYYAQFLTGTMTQDDNGGAGSGSQVASFINYTFAPSATIVNAYGSLISPTVAIASGKSVGNSFGSVIALTVNGAGTCFNNVSQKIFGPAASGAGAKTYGYGLQVFKGSGCTYNYAAYFDDLQLGGNLTLESSTLPSIKFKESGFNDVAGILFQTSGTGDSNYLALTGSASNVDPSSQTIGFTVTQSGKCLAVQPTAGLGYGTGAGGTVTQATSKTTAVTINKVTGLITMNNASMGANTTLIFTVNNSAVALGDTVQVSTSGGFASDYRAVACSVANGSFKISLANIGTTQSEALTISFTVLKGASS